VACAEVSDFDVGLTVSAVVKAAASGIASGSGRYIASNVRDFAALMSEDYVCNSKSVETSGKKPPAIYSQEFLDSSVSSTQ